MKQRVPANYTPRVYQRPFLRAMDKGIKRACLVWHRRSGKSKTLMNFTIKKAFERVGTYFHCFPEYGQARKTIWDGIDKATEKRYLDLHIPEELRTKLNNTEMKTELVNGSIYQFVGADNYNSIVGSNPVGIILDEWAVSERYAEAWDYFRPILAENGGWAVFVYTPRGRNHGWTTYQMAQKNKDWFCQLLTVDDTKCISDADIQKERDAGMSENMIQQEFYCSFLASTGDIVIPFYLIQEALKRDAQYPRSGRIAGLDVARFGDDRSAFLIRQGGQVIHVETWGRQDTTYTAGRVVQAYKNKLYDCVAVDVIGIGAGVYDMIKNSGVPCVPVNVSESSTDDRFARLRDQLWWTVREWFEEGACSISDGIPEKNRNDLIADIQDIHYEYNLKGQIKIESKDEMKERLGVSPDTGDALCCTFAPGIEFKIKEADRIPFGMVTPPNFGDDYDPLSFGLGG